MSAADDRGGKESLIALGWSRTECKDWGEAWERDKDGRTYELFIGKDPLRNQKGWHAAIMWYNSSEYIPGAMTEEDMHAVLRRIEELKSGDAE